MKQLLCLTLAFFCATTTTSPRRKTPSKPPVAIPASPTSHNKAPTELHVLFEYSIADAVYQACVKKEQYIDQIIKGVLKGLAKMVVMKTFLDAKCYKTATAAHVLMQNFTLVKNALNDPSNRKNLAHHMIVRTGLPVILWYARALHNSQQIKWVF